VSEAVENYAKAIFALQGKSDDGEVSTTALAERLGVGAASASSMVRKLDELGLVDHAPYKGVRLTAEGERVALKVIRSHRLLELFLAEVLDVPWDRVHAEAEVLEHHISDELEELIALKLGDPERDPHGDPIPSRELELAADDTVALEQLEPGDRGTFERVSDADPEMLRHLSERGIAPGDALEVVARQPFDGPLEVRFGKRVETLGGGLARAIRVRPA